MIASLPSKQRTAFLRKFTDQEIAALAYDWTFWARPKQLPPEWAWTIWLVNAGRGFGKTRTGAETVRLWKDQVPVIHFIGPTTSATRDVMVEGQSGILSVSPPWDRPLYEPSKRKLTWKNGAMALLFSADEPDRLRGPQCQKAWADEPAHWRFVDAWDQMMFGLRLGTSPQVVATTTPRPTPLIRGLMKRDGQDVAVTVGSTYENRTNLAPAFFKEIIRKYEGTRLGRQEINAEILEDVDGALWKRALIDKNRTSANPKTIRETLKRVVVAIDPAVTNEEGSAETGIMVGGVDQNDHGFLLEDLSGQYSPDGWASAAVNAYRDWKADRIIGEANNGGDLIEHTLRTVDKTIPYRKVHASRGKLTRAEPIAALDEQGKISHVGAFPYLEDQMCTWISGEKSPDRMDARVWLFTELMIKRTTTWGLA